MCLLREREREKERRVKVRELTALTERLHRNFVQIFAFFHRLTSEAVEAVEVMRT